MRWHGDIDYDNKVIRVNKSKKKNKKKGEVLNTIIHEELHRKHPKMTERKVSKKTKELMKRYGIEVKKKLYGRYK